MRHFLAIVLALSVTSTAFAFPKWNAVGIGDHDVRWNGGSGTLSVGGTFGGSTVTFFYCPPHSGLSACFEIDATNCTFTAVGFCDFFKGPGELRLTVTGGTPTIDAVAAGPTQASAGSIGGGGGNSFSAITTGTNTSATMVVNSGASLATTGTGTLNATALDFEGGGAPFNVFNSGQTMLFDRNADSVSEMIISAPDGLIGMGTLSPLKALHVLGHPTNPGQSGILFQDFGELVTVAATESIQISGAAPRFVLDQSNSPLDEKIWDILALSSRFAIRTLNDATSATQTAIEIVRTGTNVDHTTIANGRLGVGTTGLPSYAVEIEGQQGSGYFNVNDSTPLFTIDTAGNTVVAGGEALQLGPSASPPQTAASCVGCMYFDTSSTDFCGSNGSSWVSLNGGPNCT